MAKNANIYLTFSFSTERNTRFYLFFHRNRKNLLTIKSNRTLYHCDVAVFVRLFSCSVTPGCCKQPRKGKYLLSLVWCSSKRSTNIYMEVTMKITITTKITCTKSPLAIVSVSQFVRSFFHVIWLCTCVRCVTYGTFYHIHILVLFICL